MPDDDAVTQWIQGLMAGEREAAQSLWERYFHKLVRLAGKKLPDHARRAFDEEDVALSAFVSFITGVRQDRFPQLFDRDNLWKLLVVITSRKAHAYLRRQNRQKRGGGRVQGESGMGQPGATSVPAGLDAVLGQEPTPEFAAQVAEECQRLLDLLPDETIRTIAQLKMQGYTVEEIAQQLACSKRSVERRLHIIRLTWTEANPLPDDDT